MSRLCRVCRLAPFVQWMVLDVTNLFVSLTNHRNSVHWTETQIPVCWIYSRVNFVKSLKSQAFCNQDYIIPKKMKVLQNLQVSYFLFLSYFLWNCFFLNFFYSRLGVPAFYQVSALFKNQYILVWCSCSVQIFNTWECYLNNILRTRIRIITHFSFAYLSLPKTK